MWLKLKILFVFLQLIWKHGFNAAAAEAECDDEIIKLRREIFRLKCGKK